MTSEGSKLKIRLPGITKALQERSDSEYTDTDSEMDLSHLPPTPSCEEELYQGLASYTQPEWLKGMRAPAP